MSTNLNLFEEKGEPKRNRTEDLLLTSLTPYSYAGHTRYSVLVMDLYIYIYIYIYRSMALVV